MDLLNVGDRVQNQSGWVGSVTEVTDTSAVVVFDDGQPSSPFPRDEHTVEFGVLKRL